MAGGNTLEFTDANFDSEVMQSDQPVLVDFWADHCPPCHALAPMIDEIADDYAGKAKVGKLDMGRHLQAPLKLGVSQLPTILILKNGAVLNKFIGVTGKKVHP